MKFYVVQTFGDGANDLPVVHECASALKQKEKFEELAKKYKDGNSNPPDGMRYGCLDATYGEGYPRHMIHCVPPIDMLHPREKLSVEELALFGCEPDTGGYTVKWSFCGDWTHMKSLGRWTEITDVKTLLHRIYLAGQTDTQTRIQQAIGIY